MGTRTGPGTGMKDGDGHRAPRCSPPHLREPSAQVVLPAILRGGLGDEDPVSTAGQGGDESQVAGGAEKEAVWGFSPSCFIRTQTLVAAWGTYPQ